jgi:phosphatidate cytidylyltransferase
MLIKLMILVGFLFPFGAWLINLSHKLSNSGIKQIREDWIKYGIYFLIICSVLLIAYAGRHFITLVLAGITLGGSFELYQNLKTRKFLSVTIFLGFLFLSVICLGHLLLGSENRWFSTFSFTFLLVSVTDSFSQLWGRLLGKHKLCLQLSPGKTWEGLLGGSLSTLVVALTLSFLIPEATHFQIIGLAFAIALSGTIGDLLFSYIKRKIAIKDFSNILPGHGGILDRFDSLIVTAPVFYWLNFLLIK